MEETFAVTGMKDIEAIEAVPFQDRVAETSTYAVIEKGAAVNPDALAISFLMDGDTWDQPTQVTYGDLIHKIRQCANMFHDLGIGPQDVVTYLLPNIPQTHYVLWGAEAAGIVNPINPLLEPVTIRDICRAAGTRVLVALGNLPGIDIWQKVMKIKDEIPTLEHVICIMGPGDSDRIHSFEQLVEKYPGDRLIFDRIIAPDDVSSLYHTGGTTGTPKLARRTHYNEVVMGWMIQTMGGMGRQTTVLCGLPLFHVNGTTVTGISPFSMGAHVVILSPRGYRDPSIIKNFYKIVERYGANFFSAVPTVLSTLMDIPVDDADISSLQYAICGAAPLSVEMFKRFEVHTGMKVLEGYGLTEGACASSINPRDGERKVGSIGIRMPYQLMKVVIVDEQEKYLRDANVGEIGAIIITGPNVFKGYVDEAHNKGIWVQDGWFNTGDLGRIDSDGYFWLTGRKKELIIRGGHNIDPATIEAALYRLPDVQVAAAVPQPDPHAGEVPVAYVQLAADSTMTGENLLEYARENIGERAAVPKAIHIIDTVPLTPVGKIFKPALRWDVIEKIYNKELAGLGDLAEKVSVSAGEDKVHGTRVAITVTPASGAERATIEKKIAKILARYTLKYAVIIQ
ncbi:MAG: acyl-CoA synthetase [Desulfosarcina sp.]|nr:acyl-CoA synthetase [Desulfosarcina sp.]MBC2744349.1 acyl-CoA synthetase [Desulfosarcina sp.]MBC2767258.1 acyl-CoA synthetase [Desulfosarcina sp.]